jgi:hypothetical protein
MKLAVWIAALVATTFAFSAQALAKIKPEDRASVHVIGLIVELGDQAEIKTIGVTAFGNTSSQLPIGDWGLNGLAQAELQKVLGGQYVVKPAPVDAATMATIRDSVKNHKKVPLPRLLQSLPASDIDTYLVLLPTSEGLPSPSNQSIDGLGVYHQARFGDAGGSNGVVYVSYVCAVISAKTTKVIGFAAGLTANSDKPFQLFGPTPDDPRFPYVYISGGDWQPQAGALSERQKAFIKSEMTSLLTESIDYTLGKLGLVDAPPSRP